MTDEEMEYLQKKRNRLNNQMLASYEELCSSRKIYKHDEERYKNIKDRFDAIDRQLAMVDGRFKKVKPSTPGRMKKKDISVNLSGDQVIRIAEVLGIELEIE